MLLKILAFIFARDNYEDRYHPKKWDVFISIPIMTGGYYIAVFQEMTVLGISIFLLGFLLGLSIILGLNWEWIIRYWEVINEHVAWMDKHNNPDLWYALGYKEIPEKVRVIENLNDSQTLKFKELPLSPVTMNMIANKVIGTKNFDFTQELYGKLIPNFRKIQKELKEKGYLVPKNPKNVRNGYRFNRKGADVLYEFASENMKIKGDEL